MQEKVGAEDILAMWGASALIQRNEARRACKRLGLLCALLAIALAISCAAGYWTVQNLRAEHAAQVEAILQGSVKGGDLSPLDVVLPILGGNNL